MEKSGEQSVVIILSLIVDIIVMAGCSALFSFNTTSKLPVCLNLSYEQKRKDKELKNNQQLYLGKNQKKYIQGLKTINFRFKHIEENTVNCLKAAKQLAK